MHHLWQTSFGKRHAEWKVRSHADKRRHYRFTGIGWKDPGESRSWMVAGRLHMLQEFPQGSIHKACQDMDG